MRKQDYYEPIIGRESEPRRRPKKRRNAQIAVSASSSRFCRFFS